VPLKKPKSAPLPTPFKDIAAGGDEAKIMAARVIKRELDRDEGFSWNQKPVSVGGPFGGIRSAPAHRKWAALAAVGMGGLIILGFITAANTGYVKPGLGPIYFDNWEASRSSEDALADKEERMDELRARYAAHNKRIDDEMAAAEAARVAAAQQKEAARQAGLEAERRAAQGATPG